MSPCNCLPKTKSYERYNSNVFNYDFEPRHIIGRNRRTPSGGYIGLAGIKLLSRLCRDGCGEGCDNGKGGEGGHVSDADEIQRKPIMKRVN